MLAENDEEGHHVEVELAANASFGAHIVQGSIFRHLLDLSIIRYLLRRLIIGRGHCER